MRTFALLVLMLASTNSFPETIQKWTDDSGQVHYGDSPPVAPPHQLEQLEIESSFDPVAYEQALIRNSAIEAEVKQIDAREKAKLKKAEKRLDEYFRDLDRKDKDLERAKASKRKSRESERNRSSIKLKRSKQQTEPITTAPSFRRRYQP